MNSRRFVVLPAAVVLVAAGVWLGVARAGGHGMNIKAAKGVQWARVDQDGTPFGKSKDVLSTQLAFTGSYLVRLKGDVTHCAYTANTDSTEGDGEATTYQATAYGNDYVGVVTTTSAGAAADKKFNLIVACTT